MSTLRVDAIRHNSATSDAITTAADGTCTAKLTSVGGGGLSHRNIIINGAMNVAQRSNTTSTSAAFQTVDRFAMYFTGTDENPTQVIFNVDPPAQYHLPLTGPHPYKEGFRKAYGITNGNQTSGAGVGDYIYISHKIEAQDMALCGWNYTDANSFITLSFWVKSSATQNFYGYLKVPDSSTPQHYAFETGTLTAFTWKKVIVKIPGNSNLAFDLNTSMGLEIVWSPFFGADSTSSGASLNTWGNLDNSARMPDYATGWYTTNDASFQITGVQLEVGDTATTFEHRSYGEELMRCMRYYERHSVDDGNGGYATVCMGYRANSTRVVIQPVFRVPKRATNATFEFNGPMRLYYQNNSSEQVIDSWTTFQNSQFGLYGGYKVLDRSGGVGGSDGYTFRMEGNGNAAAYIAFESEL